MPRDILLPAPPHRTDHGTGQCRRGPPVQPGHRQRLHYQVLAHHRPRAAKVSGGHVDVLPGRHRHHRPHARAGDTPAGRTGRQRGPAARRPAPAGDPTRPHDARDRLAAASAKFEALADAADNVHGRGFLARAQEQTARYAATLAYVRTLEDGIPESWEHVHYTRPEVDQAEAVITWHGELIRSYAIQAASEAGTGLGLAGLPPPFDTSGPEGTLHDDGASLIMVGANSANSANFWGDHREKLAELANFAPRVNFG